MSAPPNGPPRPPGPPGHPPPPAGRSRGRQMPGTTPPMMGVPPPPGVRPPGGVQPPMGRPGPAAGRSGGPVLGRGGPPLPGQQAPGRPGPLQGASMARGAPIARQGLPTLPGALSQRPGPPPQMIGRAIQRTDVAMSAMTISSTASAATPPSGTQGSGTASGGGTVSGNGSQPLSAAGALAGRGIPRGRREQGFVLRTRPAACTSKIGSAGDPFNCMTNYFKIRHEDNWNLYQYRVDFKPEEDMTITRKAMIRQHQERLKNYIFDGTMLFTVERYTPNPAQPLLLTCTKDNDPGVTQASVRLVGECQPTDFHYIQFFNIVLRKCMEGLDLQLLGRNYFDPKARIMLPDYKLELWPGYVTSIRQHERELLMCCEISTKILRTDTVLDQLVAAYRRDSQNYQNIATRMLLGCIVITRYNNKTYKVDDILWKNNPTNSFPRKGVQCKYVDYFEERYKLKIRDMKQPLISSNPNAQQRRAGITEPIILIPELCYMTGLSDEQRADFKLMKAVGEYTRTAPPQRCKALMAYASRMSNTPAVKDELSKWNMRFDPDLKKFQGRTFKPEIILQGKSKTCSYKLDNADWGAEFRNFTLFGGVNCQKWIVIYAEREKNETMEFVKSLQKVSAPMGFLLSGPKPFQIATSRTQAYVEKLQEVVKMGPQMIMVVIPNNKSDAYHAIKKICCVDAPVPSQVMTGTVLKKPKGLMSVATKVAVQMASKLGGEPWAIKMPQIDGLMVIGYDSWHDTTQKGTSVGAVVSTVNSTLTRYTSSCTFHKNNEEMLDQIRECITKAIRKYKEFNQALPKRVVIYRDGVGDGQIPYVVEHEIASIRSVFKENEIDPKFTYIIVSKRINSRFFKMGSNPAMPPANPPSGSIIDDHVTLPERYDFYLISQSVRQGTVNPTSYNVIEDTSGWPANVIQQLSYKLTHLYYNWPGTVRVPCVCQYAHKLAYLVGQSIHRRPSERLEDLLYFL